jgi:drug/metabolite transporter (DMT)-like permease
MAALGKAKQPTPEPVAATDEARFTATDVWLLLMTVIWGSNFTAIKYSLEDFLPLTFNGLRFAIASAVMLLVTWASGSRLRVAGGDGWRLFGLGLLANTFYQSLFILGMAHTRAGNAALILATAPFFTAAFSRLRKEEYFRGRGISGLLLAFAGIALIILSGEKELALRETLLGDALLVGATVCWSLYTVGSKGLIHRYGPVKTTAIMMASGTPVLLVICAPSLVAQDWSHVRPIAWGGLAYSALFAIALAYIIWNQGVSKIGSTRTAIYSNITPIVAVLVAWPLLGEAPTMGQVAGAVVIFIGLYLVRHGMTTVAPAEARQAETEDASRSQTPN